MPNYTNDHQYYAFGCKCTVFAYKLRPVSELPL